MPEEAQRRNNEINTYIREPSEDEIHHVFPNGIAGSYLMQGDIVSSRYVASLHSLKRNPCALSVFQHVIRGRYRRTSQNQLLFQGWRLFFCPPFDQYSVDVADKDMNDVAGNEEEDNAGTRYEWLHSGQCGDKIILIGIIKWRKSFGLTDNNVDRPGATTIVFEEEEEDPNELFKFCLNNRIVREYNIVAEEEEEEGSLQTLVSSVDKPGHDHVLFVLDQFAQYPHLFVLTAEKVGISDGQTYSLVAVDLEMHRVTLADPRNTQNEVTMPYETFTRNFRRLAGLQLQE
jgi:hypothetical protein